MKPWSAYRACDQSTVSRVVLKSSSLTYGPVCVLASPTTVVPLPLPALKLRSVSCAPVQA